MKRIITLAIVAIIATTVSAQTQQGYVKTKGRLSSTGKVIKGTPLSGAIVQVRGRNSVMSGGNGTFSFSIPSGSFSLESVKKQGYVLNDPDILSKTYSLSKNPLVLVLDNVQQRNEERKAIERKVRSSLWADLNRRDAEIESLKEQNKITEERYRELRQQLTAYEDENQNIIDDMVERYSKIDYDELDKFNLEISNYILNGELLKADSLLKTKGDVHVRADEYHQMRNQISNEEIALAERNKKLDKLKEAVQKKLDETARDCYSWFEIYKLKHMNDSAAYYLEMRAELDTTNVEWQLDVADFEMNFVSDLNKAESYYCRALATAQKMDDKALEATSYNELGVVYGIKGNFTGAIDNIKKSIAIWEALPEDNYIRIAENFNNLGFMFGNMGQFKEAQESFEKALQLAKKEDGEYKEVATALNNMGMVKYMLGQLDDALALFKEAQTICLQLYNEDHKEIATGYDNIGGIYARKHEFNDALENNMKALDIRKRLYGEIHPEIATSLVNIGGLYKERGDGEKALEFFEKAKAMFIVFFGENNRYTALCFNNIGDILCDIGSCEKGLQNLLKALNIKLSILGEKDLSVATTYNNIGYAYECMKNYTQALENYEKALSIRLEKLPQVHPLIADTYFNVGDLYEKLGMKEKALDAYVKAEKSMVSGDTNRGKILECISRIKR